MKLTVFGEILWDIFDGEKRIGGAPFNFAAHAVREGADVCLISAVGEDELGDLALNECEKMDIPAEGISRNSHPTGTCTVRLENGTPVYDLSGDMAYDHINISTHDTRDHFPSKEYPQNEPSAFYFGTLAQRGEDSGSSLIEFLKTHASQFDEIFLDINIRQDYFSRKILDDSLRYATILKMSRDDINAIQELYPASADNSSMRKTPESSSSLSDGNSAETSALRLNATPEEFCRNISAKFPNIRLIIVTLDSDGAFVYECAGRRNSSEALLCLAEAQHADNEELFIYSDKPDCEVVSTVGAGDAFSAAFLVNYLAGRSIDICLFRANALAGFVCEHLEAVPLYPMDDIRNWRAVYRLLDMVNVEVFDCGLLCDNACCMCRGSSEDMGIYLYPGEHRIIRESEKIVGDYFSLHSEAQPEEPVSRNCETVQEGSWLTWERQDPEEAGFPASWTGPVYFVKCTDPPRCPRAWRPLQCRTFPLKPVINDNGVLELIWEDDELPYSCPIIEQNMPIHDSFYKATYTVWSHLLRDPRIMDLVLSWS